MFDNQHATRQTIRIELPGNLRDTITRTVTSITAVAGMRIGKSSIFDREVTVRYGELSKQWVVCDEAGKLLHVEFPEGLQRYRTNRARAKARYQARKDERVEET